jgi:WD40 repeat protein
MLFETDTSNNPDLVDDTLVLGTYYNYNFYEFICVCLKKIKIFSALTGKITKIYENIMQGEIMTYDKDKSLKRIYIGDNYGKIKNYNMNNGLLIKEYMSHNAEVLSLVHATCTDQLISLGNDKLIRIFSDKDVNDTLLLKEIELNQMPVIKIAVNEDFERLIMGLENKRIRFFDLHHFRLDSEVNLKKPLNRNDIVCCIFCIPRYELCLISCLSGKNYFMVTPPNNLKYHIFGEFNQIDEKEVEIISAITSININFENKELYVGDQNGFLTCYDLHELYEILDKYKKITIECLNELDKYNITKKYSYQIHKETINKIDFPIIDPNIIITTSTDRKVKLLNLEGKVIDDLKQINNKFPEVPIGIKYFIADPFLSKKNYDEITETGVIYRDEIEKKNFNLKNSIMRIRQEHPIINSYSKLITELNAKERLYLITKNSKIGNNKSNNFNFNINIELIENIENNDFKKLFDEIKKKNENLQLSSKNLQSIQIFSDNYNPTFLNDFNEEKISEFSNTLNQKMRNIKLATSKLKLEKSKYEVFEKENKRSSVINLKEVMKSLNLKTNEHKKKFDDKFKLKRREMFGLNKKNLHSTNDMFISFQEDVKKELNNLNLQLEENIKKKYLEPIREFNSTYQGKNIKGKKILPKINNNKISINKNKTVTNKIEINSEDNKNNNNNQQ